MHDSASSGLPAAVETALDDLVALAREHLREHLRAVVLYGSAAEARLRPTSDVNVVLVLTAIERSRLDGLRDYRRIARASIRLDVMYLLERELDEALEAFAEKFADIARRRRVLFGDDPFAARTPSRAAEVHRLRQVLLNLSIRLRQRYVLTSLREEQAALALADVAGPLRGLAATLLELRSGRRLSPKEALAEFVHGLSRPDFAGLLAAISEAREVQQLAPGAAPTALYHALELAEAMHVEALALPLDGP